MSAGVKLVPVQEAYDDLLNRTLAKIPCDLGRLIYLASTRDYNTGNYYHEGLSSRFSLDVARKALEIAHRQAFYKLSAFSLEHLVADLETYLKSSKENSQDFLRTWQKLEPYRVAIPTEVNLTVARLFASNLRLALAVLRFRQEPAPAR
jgi:tagatose-1,6-bisphosphate aldolase non-catalytic subunit AgaZ/GatZ